MPNPYLYDKSLPCCVMLYDQCNDIISVHTIVVPIPAVKKHGYLPLIILSCQPLLIMAITKKSYGSSGCGTLFQYMVLYRVQGRPQNGNGNITNINLLSNGL
jgi:hypothetical protein